MKNFGFVRVAAAIPEVKVADCQFNSDKILGLVKKAEEQGVQILCFPELSLTAYTCSDLFLQNTLIQGAEQAIKTLLEATKNNEVLFIIGAPVGIQSKLYNCALVCHKGSVLGIVPKQYLPNYAEFYEKRWFETAPHKAPFAISYAEQKVLFGQKIIFHSEYVNFGIEICEDVWSVIPPSSYLVQHGADLIFNLSASNELIAKHQYLKSLLNQQSARCQAGYVYSGAGYGESTTDVVYSGNAFIYESGKLLAESERFSLDEQLIVQDIDVDLLNSERRKNTTFGSELHNEEYASVQVDLKGQSNFQTLRKINPTPFVPLSDNYDETCEEIFSIQVLGLIKRMLHTRADSLLVGISGGLDSTLALLVCLKAIDKLDFSREMICGITMPGYGTTNRTYRNALDLMECLGISTQEIDIKPACEQHFKDIKHNPEQHDIVFENTQARERTQILMDVANQWNGMVIGTGDMSELALGWATYNGDHMSMYGVNAGVPKTLVRHLVKWVAENEMDEETKATLLDIIDTPISPELLPITKTGKLKQFTEDLVGPYKLHDFFLYYLLRYGFTPTKIYFLAKEAFKNTYTKEEIVKWMEVFYRRFFAQQFKRSCLPDGPKVGSVNLSPRGDWRMPSDASYKAWIKEIESLI